MSGHDDEEFGSQSTTTTSISSELGTLEEFHGRAYPAWPTDRPHYLPVDQREQERADVLDLLYETLYGGELHFAAISNPHNILDIGTGFGQWAIQVADKYPSARVVGVDLAVVQPEFVPPNCEFFMADVEDWEEPSERYDLIHGRALESTIRDWPGLIGNCSRSLRPGGWLELSGNHYVPEHDGSLTLQNSPYLRMFDSFQAIQRAVTGQSDAPTKWRAWFEEAGLTSVCERRFLLPCAPRSDEPDQQRLGALEFYNVALGAQGMLLRGWIDVLERSPEALEVLMLEVRQQLMSTRAWMPYYVVLGQKPIA